MIIELPFQMEFVINLTFKCNLRCQMCTQYGKNYKEYAIEELDIEYWINFLKQIKDINPKPKLILMGGEPFLYKHFEKFFITANNYGIKTHIITNGYYLDKYIPIIKNTDTNITVSIDGLFDVHDNIRGQKGLFQKVSENISLLDKIQKNGSKIKLRINHVMLPENIDGIVKFYEYFKKYKIDTFTFQHIQSSNEELNNLTQCQWQQRLNKDYGKGLIPKKQYCLNENFVNLIIKNLNEFKKQCTSDNCFEFPALEDDEMFDYYTNKNLDNIRKNMICATPWINPTINPNGDVSNCIGNVVGNIRNENFWDIWNNEKAQKLRDSLIRNGKFTICAKCCNFYKGNFISALEGKIIINNIKMQLPDEINFIQSSQKIAFIRDNDVEQKDEYIPAIPVNIHSKEMFDDIKDRYNVITFI